MRVFTGTWLFIASIIALSCPAHSCASGAPHHATYPREMRGVWLLGNERCSLPGNYDSDGRIEVREDALVAYEESSKPVDVLQISKQPAAWRIKSLLSIGGDGYYDKISKIFLLSGGKLIIASVDGFGVYTRCNSRQIVAAQ